MTNDEDMTLRPLQLGEERRLGTGSDPPKSQAGRPLTSASTPRTDSKPGVMSPTRIETMAFHAADASLSPACQGEATGPGAGNGLQASEGTWTA